MDGNILDSLAIEVNGTIVSQRLQILGPRHQLVEGSGSLRHVHAKTILHPSQKAPLLSKEGWLRGPRSASPKGRSLKRSPSRRGGPKREPPASLRSAPLLT